MTNKEIIKSLRNAKKSNTIQAFNIDESCDIYVTIDNKRFCIGSTVEDAMLPIRMQQYNIN